MSEKRDLWVPLVLVLAGVALLASNVAADRVGWGILALVLAWGGALACLPIRLKHGQGRNVAFGLGIALVLVPLIPGAVAHAPDALAWVVAGLAFALPAPVLPQRIRAVFLGAAVALGLLGFLALLGVLPQPLTWLLLAGAFHLGLQVLHARPRREPAPPPGPRVGILGGSFDPFHAGHRALAEAALRVVDRLLVVPAGLAPHKSDAAERTAFHHRVAMARLGVEGLARTEVLEMEGRRGGRSYTVDTLDVLRNTYPEGTRFLVLVGADMLQDFPTWRAWERILENASLLVARRPGYDVETPEALGAARARVELLEAPELDVSSTSLRAAFARDESVGELVSPAVRAYIRDHDLYRA